MCGSNQSKPTQDVEVSQSSGLHLLELHMPSAGIGATGLVLFLCAVFACYWFCCRRRRLRQRLQLPSFQQQQRQMPSAYFAPHQEDVFFGYGYGMQPQGQFDPYRPRQQVQQPRGFSRGLGGPRFEEIPANNTEEMAPAPGASVSVGRPSNWVPLQPDTAVSH